MNTFAVSYNAEMFLILIYISTTCCPSSVMFYVITQYLCMILCCVNFPLASITGAGSQVFGAETYMCVLSIEVSQHKLSQCVGSISTLPANFLIPCLFQGLFATV